MKKKLVLSSVISCVVALATFASVLAGSTFDLGLLQGTPPAGEANWTAWVTANTLPGGMPAEIMTEDSTAAQLGTDNGYYDFNFDTVMEWVIQVANFSTVVNGDNISMIFGGLGASTNKLWFYNFNWAAIPDSQTYHGTVALSTTVRSCPVVTNITINGDNKTITFFAEASQTYYLYKSTQASGAFNGASNGRYLYLATVTTNASGVGVYTDTEPLESWYTVIRKSDSSGALDGCHSEPGTPPTAATLAEFTAQTQAVASLVRLDWRTVNEFNLLGFNIYRAETLDGPRTILNPSLLLAQYLGDLQGGSYSFEDATVTAGKTYLYWIQMNYMIGVPENSDPLEVTVPYKVYLPLFR